LEKSTHYAGSVPAPNPAPTGPRECSIARALGVLGERWTLLVLRELVFGVHRFDAIAAATGASRDMLTRRLRGLEEAGLVRRERYLDHPPRYEYHLTDLGRDAGEVLLVLMRFGDRHLSPEPPVRWRHAAGTDAHELDPQLVCRRCGEPAGAGLHSPTGPGAP
jgi:DNA-binding HxlR family transcriptional regulator